MNQPTQQTVTITHAQLVKAYTLWWNDHREGKCESMESTGEMPLDELAEWAAVTLIDYLNAAQAEGEAGC